MSNKKNVMGCAQSAFVFFLAVAVGMLANFMTPAHADSVTVDISQDLGPVNYSVLGSAILTFPDQWNDNYQLNGAGVWDPGSGQPETGQSVAPMIGFAQNMGMRFSRYATNMVVNWKDAVGPNRPAQPAYYNEQLIFGLPEFLKVCHDIGSVPIILLSHDTSVLSPADAADLVAYLNAPSGSGYWADLRDNDRIALGLAPGPWNVVWFEYGNETWGQSGYTADQYVNNYLQYQSAMKAVDPNIKLGAVLENTRTISDWSEIVILGTGKTADFYITHNYDLWYTNNNGVPDSDTLFSIALAGTDAQMQAYYEQLNSLILELTGRVVPVAVTEYNGGFVQDSPVPYRHTLGNALINADEIRQLMQAQNIAAGSYWQFSNSYWGMIKGYSDPYVMRPNFYPLQFYNNHFGDRLVNAQVNVATYDNSVAQYGVDVATGTHQDEILSSTDLLSGQSWTITPVSGAQASETNNVLTIQFDGSQDVDYSNSVKSATVAPGTWYRLTGFINSDALTSSEGLFLAVVGGPNTVINGSFEGPFTTACSSGWTMTGWTYCPNVDSTGSTTVVDTSVSYTDTQSVKVTFDGSSDVNYYQTLQRNISVSPNTTYLIEGYIKTDNIATTGKGVNIEVQDSRGWTYGDWATPALTGTNGWTRVSKTFTTNSGATQVAVLLRRYSGGGAISGTAWWDDIKLYNKVETKQLTGTNPWRYVHADFRSAANTTAVSVIASRTSGGGPISGSTQLENVMLRQLTPGNPGAVPYLSVNASKSLDGSKVYLMVVNKNMTAAVSPTVSLVGDTVFSAKSWTLNGPLSSSTNETTQDVTSTFNDLGPVANGFSYTFPAHSLTALEIDRAADLVVSLTASPNPVVLGSNITYTATVTNNGPATADGINVSGLTGCTLSAGSIPSGGTASCSVAVAATTVGTVTQAVSVSGAEVDPNTVNNSATATTTVIAPDLVPTKFSASKSKGAVSISDTVSNQGNANAGSFTVSYYLSTDRTYDPSDLALVSTSGGSAPCIRTVGSLNAGALNGPSSLTCYPPSSVVGGTRYYVLAVDDATNQVIESNETNNVMATTGQVWW